jgi:hypothetical protein
VEHLVMGFVEASMASLLAQQVAQQVAQQLMTLL